MRVANFPRGKLTPVKATLLRVSYRTMSIWKRDDGSDSGACEDARRCRAQFLGKARTSPVSASTGVRRRVCFHEKWNCRRDRATSRQNRKAVVDTNMGL